HELRRLLLGALTLDPGDPGPPVLPDLPLPGVLPAVPEAGWADAVVEDEVLEFYEDPFGGGAPNVVSDPTLALGPPDGTSAGAVAVGIIGNYFTIEFADGEEALDGPGEDVLVVESDPRTGGAPEPYRVWAADAADAPFVPLGDGYGAMGFDLAGSGLDRARRVRVGGLSTALDINRGPGSPLYPGAEIDAVGAVHLPAVD
ncbi:MAG: hypothetical protein KC620_24705, partial [Myxococcales bacterium]|nr:hypothetical protein [Myxococcales bacterium]